MQALIQSGQTVPQALADLSAQYKQECNLGLHGKKKKGGGGFGGRGFTFSSAEKSRQQQERQQAKKDLGLEKDEGEEDFMDADLAPDDVFGPSASSADPSAALDPVTGLPVNLFSSLSNKTAQASRPTTDLSDPNSVQSAVAAAAAKAALLAQKSVAQAGGTNSGVGTSEGAERARVVAELLRLVGALANPLEAPVCLLVTAERLWRRVLWRLEGSSRARIVEVYGGGTREAVERRGDWPVFSVLLVVATLSFPASWDLPQL